MEETKLYEALNNDFVFDILLGDEKYGVCESPDEIRGLPLAMPHMEARHITELYEKFGLDNKCPSSNQTDRRRYVGKILSKCLNEGRVGEFLGYFFGKRHFLELLHRYSPEAQDKAYGDIVVAVTEGINRAMYFGGHEFSITGDGGFIVKKREK